MLIRGLGEFFSTYLLNLAGLRVIEAVRRDVFAKIYSRCTWASSAGIPSAT